MSSHVWRIYWSTALSCLIQPCAVRSSSFCLYSNVKWMQTVLPATFGQLTGATILFTLQTRTEQTRTENQLKTSRRLELETDVLLVTLLNINLTAGAEWSFLQGHVLSTERPASFRRGFELCLNVIPLFQRIFSPRGDEVHSLLKFYFSESWLVLMSVRF